MLCPGTHFENSRELLYPCMHCCTLAAPEPLPTFALFWEAQSAAAAGVRGIPGYKQTLSLLGGLWPAD